MEADFLLSTRGCHSLERREKLLYGSKYNEPGSCNWITRESIRHEDFAFFVARMLGDVILLAEEKAWEEAASEFRFPVAGSPSSSLCN
jgi:hypothetical protein